MMEHLIVDNDNVTRKESTLRYTQLDLLHLGIPQSCLGIELGIGLIQAVIVGSLRSFTQAQKVVRVE